MDHSFNIEHAAKYGIHEAVLISNITFWIEKNKANSRHFHDGRYWTYNSAKAFAELFPYMTVNQIRRALERLVELGILLKGNYNSSAYDRTTWYAFSDQWICEKRNIHLANLQNGKGVYAEPIPDVNTDISTDTLEAKASLSVSKLPDCPHIELLDLFSKHLPELPQPKPELWEGARAKALAARWKWCLTAKKRNGERYATSKAEALDFFERYFGYVAKSDFLTGRDDRWSGCDLAWLVKADNFAKVLQGNYENRQEATV